MPGKSGCLVLSALLLFTVFFSSCNTIDIEVSEYRYLDDYNGFIPIQEEYGFARVDLVVP